MLAKENNSHLQVYFPAPLLSAYVFVMLEIWLLFCLNSTVPLNTSVHTSLHVPHSLFLCSLQQKHGLHNWDCWLKEKVGCWQVRSDLKHLCGKGRRGAEREELGSGKKWDQECLFAAFRRYGRFCSAPRAAMGCSCALCAVTWTEPGHPVLCS